MVYPTAYQGILGGILQDVFFLPHVSKVYSLENIELVPNLATRACGGTAVYPNVHQGIPGKIYGGFAFYSMSLKCIVR